MPHVEGGRERMERMTEFTENMVGTSKEPGSLAAAYEIMHRRAMEEGIQIGVTALGSASVCQSDMLLK